ncbi:MAG: hypothetical protein ACOYLK_06320 [Sphingomonas sp.]
MKRTKAHFDSDKPLEAIHLLDIVLAVEPANRNALAVKKASLEHQLIACVNQNLSETMWLKSEISAVEAAYQ